MFKIRIADIDILIHNQYELSKFLCREYLVVTDKNDLEISCSEREITEELKASETPISLDFAESVCIHRKIAERLADFNAFLLHSALIECEGIGIAFAAHSGVGKSTHVALWKKVYGDRVRIINGDKPIVRIFNNEIKAYGTPWLGKENLGTNASCNLTSLCFISRSETNSIKKISSESIVLMLFEQVYIPKNSENAEKTLDLIDAFAKNTAFYHLRCNMDNEAAIVSYDGIMKKQENQYEN